MWLEVKAATRRFEGRAALDGLHFGLAEGEIGCLLGPSGCGKTTTLRCIAGLETLDQGHILCRGELLSGPGVHRPAHQRGIGLVFQDHALFPHLNALGNVEFGLSQLPATERRRRATDLLERVGLADRLDAFPGQLSGGQQQRVALARALAPGPSLLLMDEPFANLDVALRERLVGELGELLRRSGTTALVVTHEQQDAFTLADRIGLIQEGRLAQWGTPYDLYHRPTSRFAAEFIGRASFIPACCDGSGVLQSELGPLREDPHSTHCSGPVDVLLRPDDVVHDDDSPLKARIVERSFRGAEFLYTLELASGRRVLSVVPSHHDHRVGEAIGIRLDTDHVITFPTTG